jgi:3-methyladenine DNA glycosylase/8-oxoguanine DNA glycosylase
LLVLPGIGSWTAGCIRMRALGDPDVLLAEDVAVQAEDAEAWRPWSSCAMHHFWTTASERSPTRQVREREARAPAHAAEQLGRAAGAGGPG